MSPELWDLTQRLGIPITMLLAFIVCIHRKVFVPGWYPAVLEKIIDKLEAKVTVLENKNEVLVRRSFEVNSMARTALDVGRSIVEKET
jgi:hypothetical protein